VALLGVLSLNTPNCHLLSPRWHLLMKLAQRENKSVLRKSS